MILGADVQRGGIYLSETRLKPSLMERKMVETIRCLPWSEKGSSKNLQTATADADKATEEGGGRSNQAAPHTITPTGSSSPNSPSPLPRHRWSEELRERLLMMAVLLLVIFFAAAGARFLEMALAR